MPEGSRPWHEPRVGLRSRVALSVTGVSFVLSVVVSLTVFAVANQVLLDAREEAASLRTLKNASVVLSTRDISESNPGDVLTALSNLSDTSNPAVIWDGGANSQSLNSNFTADDLPAQLRDRALLDEEAGIMRYQTDGHTQVAVAVPIPNQRAAYFEVTPLDDIADAMSSIRLALAGAVVVSTLLAALLGSWASRYTIRPLTRVSTAAQSVALGNLDTRINYEEYRHDPDLAPLVENFNDMVQALQQRINRDARFASDVSHELRSPLTTLNAGLQVLDNNRSEMPERAQQALDLLASDVDRFTQLVEDLLEISRFDAGAVRLELDDVALVPMIRNTVGSLSRHEVPVVAEPGTEDLVIACDRRRLARILVNFCNNADKYADGATHISVSLHNPDGDDPLAEPTVRIGVEDAGPGVPPDMREEVFDRFNRGDQGGARGADIGVGLGLALVAEHARIQGGRVWVEDRVDGGSGARFVVELPVLQVRSGEPEEDLSLASPESTGNLTLTGEHRALPPLGTTGAAEDS
ncbi:MAG: HAMP domain-containing histidine kinase [Microthrixaceae bacterium]|nr:HAMP domain-containing histidine kinase [Microthrixaceae bacterium]